MMKAKEVKEWINAIDDDEFVYIDDGGLTLVHTDDNYIEIGGEPLPEQANDESA